MSRDELLGVVRNLLQDVMKARFDGVAYGKLARAHGYADGYMRALMDAGLVDRQAMLALVGEERRRWLDGDRDVRPDAA
ncbi:MAG: hypothetical protein NZ898_14715 [Myxococcota bacterium]|nr:hypothetical protein [Myxococcota bacterium]MDW8361786.1 hypothetical protein [Myxococcales bacterium]